MSITNRQNHQQDISNSMAITFETKEGENQTESEVKSIMNPNDRIDTKMTNVNIKEAIQKQKEGEDAASRKEQITKIYGRAQELMQGSRLSPRIQFSIDYTESRI